MDVFLNFDFAVLDFIAENIRCAVLDPVMWFFSMFAHNGLGWVAVGLVLLIPKKTRYAAAVSLASMVLALLLGQFAIKGFVCRPRPYDVYEAFHGFAMPFSLNAGVEHSFSFPSGHTSCSFAAAIPLFKVNKTVGFVALGWAVLVAFSRLYNYVHFPTDVIGGALIGILCAVFFLFLFGKIGLEEKLSRVKE